MRRKSPQIAGIALLAVSALLAAAGCGSGFNGSPATQQTG
jgi:hypothetical protein